MDETTHDKDIQRQLLAGIGGGHIGYIRQMTSDAGDHTAGWDGSTASHHSQFRPVMPRPRSSPVVGRYTVRTARGS